MVRFATVPVDQVVPKHKARRPSERAQVRQQYKEALSHALANDEALVVELDAEDKHLTIRNRIQRAGQQLGISNLVIRRRGQRIVAYQAGGHGGTQAGEGSPAVLEGEGIAS